jgi:hypothetical protein
VTPAGLFDMEGEMPEAPTTPPAPPTPPPPQTPPAGNEPGDDGRGGKEAILADLARERDARQAEAKRAKQLEAELETLRAGTMSETEKAIEKAKKEGRAEAGAAFNKRLVQAEVRAAAAGKLADPEDAIRFLDLDEFKVADEGDVDKKAITKALEDLVKQKPYLAAGATRPTGDADQGARGGPAGSSMNDLIRNAIRR